MNSLPTHIQKSVHKTLQSVIQTDKGQLRRVPNHVLALALFLSANVLLQGIADIVLKILSYSNLLTQLPWRTDFLFLTAISVLMGYRSLMGLRNLKYDITRSSMELSVLVELSLVVGDTVFVFEHLADIPEVIAMRIPFIVLTCINICILLYNYHTLYRIRWFSRRMKKEWK